MVCAGCGGEMVEGVHFCKLCGARVDGMRSSAGFGQQPWMPLGSAQTYGVGENGVPPSGGFTAAAPTPGMPMHGQRVRQNLQMLGISWCAWGCYRLLKGLITGFTIHTIGAHFGWFGEGSEVMPDFFRMLVPMITLTTLVMSALSILTGYGLLTARSWGRTLAMVMGILSLIRIPVGTAVGIYTLWVLAPRMSGAEYEAIAASQNGLPG